jgi:hypothetical protein
MSNSLTRIQPRLAVTDLVADAFSAAAVIGVGLFTLVLSFAIV